MAIANANTVRGTSGKFSSPNKSDGHKPAGNDGNAFTDPNAAAAAAGSPPEPKHKRGRRKYTTAGAPATGGASQKKSASLDVSTAQGILMGMHAFIAMRRDEPHWLLTEADGKAYGVALANALRHFPVQATQKALDFGALAFCVLQMELPRIYKSAQLAKMPRTQQRGPAKIFEFNSPSGAPHGNGASHPMAASAVAGSQGEAPPAAEAVAPVDLGSGGASGLDASGLDAEGSP